MSQKRIENKFQSALKDYASNIDDDQLWLEIEDSIPKKKKKRRFFIWLSFGFFIMAMGLLFFWLTPNGNLASKDFRLKMDDIKSEKIIAQKMKMPNVSEVELNTLNQDLDNKIKKNDFSNQKSQNIATSQDLNPKHKTTFNQHEPHEPELEPNGNKNELEVENQQSRKEINVPRVNILPIKSELFISKKDLEIKLKTKKQKKGKSSKAKMKPRPNIGLNYYAGRMYSKKSNSSEDVKYVDLGDDYFSHGISLSYSHFLNSKLYGRLIFSMDKSYKKYEGQVARDTLVPSSLGTQVLSSTKFGNGIIDTESGIPIVKGTYNRDVLSLNTMTSIAMGIGLGYKQTIGNWNINLEADLQKTIYYTLSGFGKQESEERIRDLNNFEDYFSYDSKYTMSSQLNLDLAISKSVRVSAGLQYQLGFSSILIEQTKHSEKINLLRANIGLKKEL